MADYIVTRKSDGAEMIRYCSSQVVEQINDQAYPLVDYAHTEWTPDAPVVAPINIKLTKLEYLRRFTVEERVAIRGAATQNPVLADYLQLMELAQEINTGDADTVAAVTMLEQVGLIAAGRAQEILNG